MAKPKTRDIIYLSQEPNSNLYWIAGITFQEFISALPKMPNLLLMKHQSDDAIPIQETGMDYLGSEGVRKLMHDDVYGWGDFWWIDVPGIKAVKTLPKQAIAELAYLARLGKVYHSPQFTGLKNRFVYMGHDDGWLLRLHSHPKILAQVLARVVEQKAQSLLKVNAAITSRTAKQLVDSSARGVAIDLRHNRNKHITVHLVGPTTDIDWKQNREWDIAERNRFALLSARAGAWTTESTATILRSK